MRAFDWLSETLAGKPTKAGQLRNALYKLWRAHEAVPGMIPTNGRFLYYELLHGRPDLVAKGEQLEGNDKKQKRTDQPVNSALTDLRKAKLIPWLDIVDETRELKEWASLPSEMPCATAGKMPK
jgi:hypothetical protein